PLFSEPVTISEPRGTGMSDNVVALSAPSVHLQPPEGLTDEQAEVWRTVVGARSADFFSADAAPLLEEYCRVVVMCRLLAAHVGSAVAGGDAGEVRLVLDLRDKESRRMTSIATNLRRPNQSRYAPQAAATAAKKGGGGKVWQFGKKTGDRPPTSGPVARET